LMLICLVLQ